MSKPRIHGPLPALPTEPLPPTPEFLERAGAIGIEFDDSDLPRLGRYLAMLLAANEVTNLTAIRDAGEAWIRHILDSLQLLPILADLPDGARVIDVGSGGGLPGVPLAICMPNLSFTLLEATGKKVEFLREVIGALPLPNCGVVQARAEAAGQDRGERAGSGRTGAMRESFDAVVARAVGPLPVLAELTVPLAKVGGLVLLIKGERAETEVAEAEGALHMLKATHEATVVTPTSRVVVLGKHSATPRTYPRADGEPKRAPLGVKKPARDSDESRD